MSGLVHWVGELHGRGALSYARRSDNEADVSCSLCLTLLAGDFQDWS